MERGDVNFVNNKVLLSTTENFLGINMYEENAVATCSLFSIQDHNWCNVFLRIIFMFVPFLERSIYIVVSVYGLRTRFNYIYLFLGIHVTGQFRLLEFWYSTNKENL